MDDERTTAPADLSGLTDSGLIRAVIITYGVLHGPPPGGDALTVDLTRALHNPASAPAMIQMTGLDAPVRRHVMATPGAREIVERTVARARAALTVAEEAGEYVQLHVYCKGGRHRSVAVAEEAAARLRASGIATEVEHRDIDKPVVSGGGNGGSR